jgi:hypothetical protein
MYRYVDCYNFIIDYSMLMCYIIIVLVVIITGIHDERRIINK